PLAPRSPPASGSLPALPLQPPRQPVRHLPRMRPADPVTRVTRDPVERRGSEPLAMKRRRTVRIVKWTGTIACVLILFASLGFWFFSFLYASCLTIRPLDFTLANGWCYVMKSQAASQSFLMRENDEFHLSYIWYDLGLPTIRKTAVGATQFRI